MVSWREVTLFPWEKRAWQPCIKCLTGPRPQDGGKKCTVQISNSACARYAVSRHHNANEFVKIFSLCNWVHWFYDWCFSSVVFRLLLFVDEADAFLRKRNQVKKWTSAFYFVFELLLDDAYWKIFILTFRRKWVKIFGALSMLSSTELENLLASMVSCPVIYW